MARCTAYTSASTGSRLSEFASHTNLAPPAPCPTGVKRIRLVQTAPPPTPPLTPSHGEPLPRIAPPTTSLSHKPLHEISGDHVHVPPKRIKLPNSTAAPSASSTADIALPSAGTAPPAPPPNVSHHRRLWRALRKRIAKELAHRQALANYHAGAAQQYRHLTLSQLQLPCKRKSIVIPLHGIPPLKDGLPCPKRLIIRYSKKKTIIFRRSARSSVQHQPNEPIVDQLQLAGGHWPFAKAHEELERRAARMAERRHKRGGWPPFKPRKVPHYYRPSFKPFCGTINEEEEEQELNMNIRM